MPSPQLIVLPRSPDASESYSAADQEIGRAISLAQENLLRQQKPDGHWCGELLVDSTLCSDYVVFMHWCGEVDAQLQRRCIRHILKRQLPDGGWNIYHGGPSEINASVKAYFALKLAGCSDGCAVYAGSARDDHAPGRDSADEHVQQALPRIAWCVPLEIFAVDSGGDGAPAELGSFPHLQNVVVEPGDAHSAVHYQSL